MDTSPPEPWLIEAARRRTHEFADQLRGVSDTSKRVPNLEWTVADLAQHVAGMPEFWQARHADGDHFELPDDFASYSDDVRAHITETDANELADLIVSGCSSYIDDASHGDHERWIYGNRTSTSLMLGNLISELVLHGRDLASVTGAPAPTLERNEALVAADAMMITTPVFIDPEKAKAQPDGTYHVRFRGGNDYTWTKTDDQLIVTKGKPAKADAHLNTDPATFVMSALGRISQVRAGLSGKMVTYGKRPWRFLGLGTIAIDGV